MHGHWILLAALVTLGAAAWAGEAREVERWGIFELALNGPKDGNPFVDVKLSAQFKQGDRVLSPEGFYDGDGVYRVRFMPDALGAWSYTTRSDRKELDGQTGTFTCTKPSAENHGPVRVRNRVHFAYADGTPYYQVGTTCYAWVHQGDALEEQTLATLRKAPFNKIRMCVFPKSYTYNKNEPEHYPYQGTPPRTWDFARFNPAFWRHFERRVADLSKLGIEADLIVFHPYDRWGFKAMTREQDDFYLRYLVARLAAFRNVWWSLANEFDLMLKIPSKKMSDWDRFFQIIRDADPYGRLRGIHNCRGFYDHSKPWVTHCSIQSSNLGAAAEWRAKYNKPIVYDECKYEGNIPQGWGNISAREMVHRFYLGGIAGCYVGHGETYKHPKDILWWSKGGVLHGQSPPRIALFRRIMEAAPYEQMAADPELCPGKLALARPGVYYLIYCPDAGPVSLTLPGSRPYRVEAIDTWAMKTITVGAAKPGKFDYTPPAERALLRLTAYKPGEPLPPMPEAAAKPTEGKPPLTVQFTGGPAGLKYQWDFGDGDSATEASPAHTYAKPGYYTATLTITDKAGNTAAASVRVIVDPGPGEPLVRVGLKSGQTPVKLHGGITQGKDGTLTLPARGPWGWVAVGPGERPLRSLEGLRSFTLCGWARPTDLQVGRGGNRIAFNLNYNKAGFDLVHHPDGRLRLAVNQWPDRVRNDSSRGKLTLGTWTFFAVTYDGTKRSANVRWYFGGPTTPAALDRTTSHNAGPTGAGSGVLTIGNYNPTIHRHGTDRQFRGQLHAVQIVGSRIGAGGALAIEAIRKLQTSPDAVPDFKAAPPPVVAPTGRRPPRGDGAGTDEAAVGVSAPVPPAGTRPRVVATTDGEIDDRCSMVRFLLYANEWEIEAIIYSSSKFHWDGHHWAGTKWIQEDIDRYATFHDTLKRHAPGFPTPRELKARTFVGNIRKVGAMDDDTPGSDRIVELLLDPKPGPVYLQAWGGTNTIARALKKIQESHPDQMAKVSRKAIVYIILDQDTTFRKYIQPNWPDLLVLGSFGQFGTIAYSWDRKIPRALHKHFDAAWMKANILRGHGPLCARYEAHPRKGFRSEGDSPAFMHQIPVGLRSLEHPGYGGWGGRFVKEPRSTTVWRGARDGGDRGKPIWRWAEAFQNDWAARADWCVKSVGDANHPPRAKLAGPLDRTVEPGQKVALSAEGSTDPDGDTLSYRWWQYADVDTAAAKLQIAEATARTGASFVVPNEPGKTLHLILEVTDDGDPPLTRYQRIIFSIAK